MVRFREKELAKETFYAAKNPLKIGMLMLVI